MQRVSRLKFIILAMIACVILFCIAAFSVSFAKWNLGATNPEVNVKGNASNFYVEYPQYISGSGENEEEEEEEENQIIVPPLDNGDPSKNRPAKYYLQVPQRGNTGMADFYEFKSHTDDEVKLESVYLYQGDILTAYKGTSTQKINSYSGLNLTLGSNVTLGTGYISVENKKLKVQTEGFYDFYYVKNGTSDGNHCYVNYVGKPSEDNGNNQGNTVDTTGYTELFSIKFSDDALVRKLYFKTATGASSPYNNLDNFAVHIRNRDPGAEGYYYNTNTYPGKTGAGDGNMRYVRRSKVSNALEGQTLNVGTKAETVIVFGFEQAHMSNASTDSGVQNLVKYAANEINLIILHTEKNTAPVLKTSGLGGVSNPADERTAIAPAYEGTTDFNSSGTVSQTLNTKKTVRKVTSGAQGAGRKYVYKNYICVSRKNSAATDDDNTIAYLEFDVSSSNVNPYYVRVTSLKLKRRATDANGNIEDRYVNPAPRIYNYDSNLDTRLGPDDSVAITSDDNMSNPNNSANANRYPLFARGIVHTSFESSAGHMKKHYDDGVYVVLYFGDNDQQYFALDIEIELEITNEVDEDDIPDAGLDFTLKAQAANSNSWERYADGYGEPWGYYMGGLINSVETWDPSRTTKLERANNRYVTDYDASLETPKLKSLEPASNGEIEKASQSTLDAFNALENFNYKIIKFFKDTGALEGYARYPKGKIDVSLTVNLTEGSLIKIYMVDHDGHRLNGHTVYVVPSEIVYDKETKKLFTDETYDIYDKDLNIVIPKTGTYIFRLVGYFRTRNEEVEDTNGNILTGDRVCLEDGKRYAEGAVPSGYNSKSLPNFNLWVDTLYITCSSAGEGNSECTIKLNANGGAFANKDLKGDDTSEEITRIVMFGSDIRNLPQPVNGDKELLGWFYEDDSGNTFDFDFGSAVTESITLKAKWAAKYLVTFNANGGTLPNGVVNPITTDKYGNLTKTQWDTFKPTYTGHKFLGWFTAQTGGTKLGTDTTFTKDRMVYAHWEESYVNGVYVNGVLKGEFVTNLANEEVKVTGLEVTEENAVITAWYNQAACAVKSGNSFATQGTTEISLNKGVYTFYYRYAGDAEHGLWIALDKYVITFDANEGTFTGSANTKHVQTGSITSGNASLSSSYVPADPTRTGYRFDGWYTAASGGTKVTNPAKSYSSSITLYAHWVQQYTITFIGNGGTWAGNVAQKERQIDAGTKVPNSYVTDEPTRSGHHFKGWYTVASGGSPFDFDTVINAEQTVYAQWDKEFTITFNVNGSGGTVNPTSAKTDATTGQLTSLPTPSRTGYRFVGWYTSQNGGSQVTSTDNNTFSNNATLYAQWDQAFTITFDANGGTVTPTSDTTNAANGRLDSLPTPTRTGYRFNGWYNATGDKITLTTTFTGNTALTAGWVQQFTVTFNATDGSWTGGGDEQSHQVDINTKIPNTYVTNIPDNAPADKEFDCWSTTNSSSGGTAFDFTQLVTGDITLYAQWKDQGVDPNEHLTYESSSAGGAHLTGCFQGRGDSTFEWKYGYKMTEQNYTYVIDNIYLYEGDYFDVRLPNNAEYRYSAVENPNTAYIEPTSDDNNIRIKQSGYYTITFLWTNNPTKITINYNGSGESTCNAPKPASNQIVIKVTGLQDESDVKLWLWMNGTNTYDYFGNVWNGKPSMTKDADGCWYYVVTRANASDVASNLKVIFALNNGAEKYNNFINVNWGNTFTYAA